MKRRNLLTVAGAATAAGALTACTPGSAPKTGEGAEEVRLSWKMVTSWPPNFPGLGTAANRLADMITKASGGRLTIKVYGGGELVPPFEVFDAVSRGTAEMGHSGAYYWKGKSEAAPFFCAVPFGLNAQEMNAWLYHGGGLELWRELYATFNLVPFPAGNTGVQMAGWFKKEVRSLRDFAGLKMRIPGLGGEVFRRVGGAPVNIPGAELFTALDSGAIDAAEWVGPYNDLAFGLYKAARYYYYPGWQEPGATLECMIHKPAFDALPADLQMLVEACCRAVNDDMLAEFTTQNHRALTALVEEHKVEVRRLPADVLTALRTASDELLAEMAGKDPVVQRVHESVVGFREQARQWHKISEMAYYEARE
jgi:TRAP-type mannitol/chloroaromatic compound transport system substrate-binding protein